MTAPVGSEGPSALDGAGVLSSYADFGPAFASGEFDQVVWTSVAAGLDTLGFVADPFGSLISAGIGWLIEHVSFLHEPIDVLAGDPEQVTDAARSWHAVSVELASVAAAHRGPVTAGGTAGVPPGWEGAAADAYRVAAAVRADAIEQAAARADRLAVLLVSKGAEIGTIRSLIRDSIADFVADQIEKFVVGALTAALTAGTSVVAMIGWAVFEAIALADRIGHRIAALLTSLAESGRAISGLAAGIQSTARAIGSGAHALHLGAQPWDEAFGLTKADEVIVEAGKQYSAAELEDPADQPA